VSFPFVKAAKPAKLPITELAASSMVVWEISLRIKEVLEGMSVD